jgi:uncharacterized protein YndB with AHSA1/START domain
MTVAECALEPAPGGRVLLVYRDADGLYRSEGRVVRAREPEQLVFDLSVLDADGAVLFTGHHCVSLTQVPDGTQLQVDLEITETTVGAVPAIAGIPAGWGQVLDNLAHTIARRKDPR